MFHSIPGFPRRLGRRVHRGASTIVDSFNAEKEVNNWIFDFIKTYLYALHTGVLKHTDLEVETYHGMTSINHPVIAKPNISFRTDSGLVKVEDSYVYAHVRYGEAYYYISLIRMNDDMRGIVHEIVVSGTSPKSTRPDVLRDLIESEAINNSMYRGKLLRVVEAVPGCGGPKPIDVEIIKDLENAVLDDVFLPQRVSKELRRFVECVVRYDELKTSLRYILSGPPGTAKTRVVRSIAKACEGKATMVLASGGDWRLNQLFTFANIFKPAILCVDDIDLVVGDRHRGADRNVLGTFLQKMDGFVNSHLFVLSTTNDKRTLDMAASRPGRFDQVIDMGALEPRNYLDLVKRRTQDPQLLALFGDGDVLTLLKEKGVVGAFLANLVKQAVINIKTNGKEGFSKKELLNIINSSYKGFCMEPQKTTVGFSSGGFEDEEFEEGVEEKGN
jgi:hypothetical protein